MSTEFSEWWKNLGTVKQALMISCIAIVLIAIVCMIIALVMMNKKNKTNDQNKTDDETQNNQDNNRQSEEEENINNLNTNNLNQNTNNISNVNENQNNNTLNTNNMMSESFSQNNNINSSENNNLQNNQSNGILTLSDLETDGYKKGTILYPNGAKLIVDGEFKNGRLFNGMTKTYYPDGLESLITAMNGMPEKRTVYDPKNNNTLFEGQIMGSGVEIGKKYYYTDEKYESLYAQAVGRFNRGFEIDTKITILNYDTLPQNESFFIGIKKDGNFYDGVIIEKKQAESSDKYNIMILSKFEKGKEYEVNKIAENKDLPELEYITDDPFKIAQNIENIDADKKKDVANINTNKISSDISFNLNSNNNLIQK